ncbi:MAG: UDP-N-acetylmuramoyl-tripeptide--D-alanyl-D-alanine ligase [Verrucomicrobia bacterium]|nr:UDP-N-acetylmuramoyl-tripeptide--D-alanyl-D-alanine ligase [Verrucomicrobiota bacterium]
MDPLPLSQLAAWAGAADEGQPVTVTGVSTDSRTVRPGELFVAIRGEKFDGHDHVAAALASGACAAVVQSDFAGAAGRLLRVADPLAAYQAIAGAYRATLPLRVIGITGSNGKTSVKDFTAAVLGHKFRTFKTEKNFNNHIGVPRMLLSASAQDEVAVLEMGMNHAGEIAPLARMARPEAAIITNIGTAHIEHLGSRQAIAAEKSVLSESVPENGFVVINGQDDFADFIAARTPARVVRAGLGTGDVFADHLRVEPEAMHFRVHAHGASADATVHALGTHMVINATLAIATGLGCGLSLEECLSGLAEARLTAGRLQRRSAGGLNFLDDTYNANPDSMVAALETLRRVAAPGRRLAVLGRMGELGETAESGHRRVGAASVGKADVLLVVGGAAPWMSEAALQAGHGEVHVLADPTEAARWLRAHATADDLILLKGSRSVRMEQIFEALHSTHS